MGICALYFSLSLQGKNSIFFRYIFCRIHRRIETHFLSFYFTSLDRDFEGIFLLYSCIMNKEIKRVLLLIHNIHMLWVCFLFASIAYYKVNIHNAMEYQTKIITKWLKLEIWNERKIFQMMKNFFFSRLVHLPKMI